MKGFASLILIALLFTVFASPLSAQTRTGTRCTDKDRDGICDIKDNCIDTDHDGFGDKGYSRNVCKLDNCPLAYNPSQVDYDKNGIGFACDVTDVAAQGVVAGNQCTTQVGDGRFEFQEFDYLGELTGDSVTDVNSVVSVAIGDLDGANGPDLVGYDHGTTTRGLKILLNRNNGGSPDALRYLHYALPTTFSEAEIVVRVGNLDGVGGANDVVVTYGDRNFGPSGSQYGQVAVFRNFSEQNGVVAFQTESTCSNQQYCNYATGKFPRSVILLDANDDGWTDIATTDSVSTAAQPGKVSIRLNLGPNTPGKFGPLLVNGGATIPGFVPASDKLLYGATGDLNCDGKDDIVASYQRSGGGGYVAVLVNGTASPSGPVTFVGERLYSAADGVFNEPISLAVAELNGSGGPEIIVANRLNLVVSILGNTRCGGESAQGQYLVSGLAGAGAMADPSGSYVTPIEPWSITANDFDDDNDIDIGISSGTSPIPQLTLLENNGSGGFETDPRVQQTFCLGALDPQPLVSEDLDANGRYDFGVAFRGAFGSGGGLGVVVSEVSVVEVPGTGDCDIDGDIDLQDYSRFQQCYTGPRPAGSPPLSATCKCVDLDADNDVDLVDQQAFMNCYSGPGVLSLCFRYGDCDADRDVDSLDYQIFSGCYTGPLIPGMPPLPSSCQCVDLDGDGDVDLADQQGFMNCYSGSGVPSSCS